MKRPGPGRADRLGAADGHRMVLYFTGKPHAEENLAEVLKARAAGLDPPIQMCDGLNHNVPEEIETILGNCLVHARRGFVRVNESFPDEVGYVLEEIALVYRNEERTKAEGMSPAERLLFHQEKSGPVMSRLKRWMDDRIEAKKTETNSGLGKAIEYCRSAGTG